MNPFEALLAWQDDAAVAAPDGLPAGLGLEPLGVIGRGAGGTVYRARDPELDREVAVKVAATGRNDALVREARVTARVEHPAVLAVHRLVRVGDVVCVEYRLAPTTTLEAVLADQAGDPSLRWPLGRGLRYLHGVAAALAAAHALGIRHGDLHPGNLLVGPQGEPYVIDWGAPESQPGSLSGHPRYAPPEAFNGEDPGFPGDVWSIGAVLWEIATGRPFRPRRPGEELGAFVARWRDLPPPALSSLGDLPSAVGRLVGALLAAAPDRPSAAAVADELAALLGSDAEGERRAAEAEGLLAAARDAQARNAELARRLAEEQRVVAIQRAKVPGYAPLPQKRPLWEAEARALELEAARDAAWIDAAGAATCAVAVHPGATEARVLLAELWWRRLRDAEATGQAAGVALARRLLLRADDGRFAQILQGRGQVSLHCDTPGATAKIARFVERGRVLVPEVVDERALPLEKLELVPGSWLITVEAPGRLPSRYPVRVERLEHHRGFVRLFTADQVGEGWVHVPAGPFRLGGDRQARQPLEPCTPTLPDFLVLRTCVRTDEWLAFLDDLPVREAAAHVPGESGIFGGERAYWQHDGTRWRLPEGWDPSWPIMAVNAHDAEAYAAWRSRRERRALRLPTEEEWEKAARGVDGRCFPWGDHFDPTFAHMRQSRPGPIAPAPVASYPVDCSVYGCMDMGGGMREWTSSLLDEGQLVLRGGTWGDDADDLRCACRSGLQPAFRYSFVSFRLVAEVTSPGDAGV